MNYFEQHENTTAADIMFIKWWRDIATKHWIAKKQMTNKYFEKILYKVIKYCIYLYLNCNIKEYYIIHCSLIYLKY